jgi:ribosome biogenesis GTPase / thiamine phosphate phosphatase
MQEELPGRVIASHGRTCRVELAGGEVLECVSRGRKRDIACGDEAIVRLTSAGHGVLERISPRSNLLYRSDRYRQKLIAANVTQVVILVAAVPTFYDDLIDRCLVAAEHGGIAVLICLNKAELPESAAAAARLGLYTQLGYSVVPLSAKRDISPLRSHLAGHTTVLVGQSGMGKSTIVNALVPQALARVAEVSSALDSGRHTTTHAELYRIDGDTRIIDSPGMQEFGLQHLTVDDAAQAFVEFRPALGQCRFHNCRHLTEPGCAVAAACVAGTVADRRLASYRRLALELTAVKRHDEPRRRMS